ncbi:MAG: hypothetical protein JNM88_12240 [Chitinophagaceae bacterium]|nr:hypothetical protein [Chitinophagaceae bacterium]
MKKALALISFACYFILTSGFVVNRHYCMERLASVHFFETETEVCGLCGMETHESNGCCRDEVTVVKLAVDQSTTAALAFSLTALEPLEIVPSSFIAAPVSNTEDQRHFHNHSPPLLSAQDTYLRNNVFRI